MVGDATQFEEVKVPTRHGQRTPNRSSPHFVLDSRFANLGLGSTECIRVTVSVSRKSISSVGR